MEILIYSKNNFLDIHIFYSKFKRAKLNCYFLFIRVLYKRVACIYIEGISDSGQTRYMHPYNLQVKDYTTLEVNSTLCLLKTEKSLDKVDF